MLLVKRELISREFDVDHHNLLYTCCTFVIVLGPSPLVRGGRGTKIVGIVRMYGGPVVEARRRAVIPVTPSTPSDARCAPARLCNGSQHLAHTCGRARRRILRYTTLLTRTNGMGTREVEKIRWCYNFARGSNDGTYRSGVNSHYILGFKLARNARLDFRPPTYPR